MDANYPVIESLVERSTPDALSHLFDEVKNELATLKGPRAEQAKKVQLAISRTEVLLAPLLQVRENLEAERKGRR